MTHGGYRPGSGRKAGKTPPMQVYSVKLPEDVILKIPSAAWAREILEKAVQSETKPNS